MAYTPSSPSRKQRPAPPGHRAHGGTSIAGAIVFILGRAADPAIQYALFRQGYAAAALRRVGLGVAPTLSRMGPGLGGLGPVPTLLVGMYSTAALRHIYWLLFRCHGHFPPAVAAPVSIFNWAMNAYNTLVATYTLSKATNLISAASSAPTFKGWASALGWYQWVGLGLFATGIVAEIASEETRVAFKRNPANKGKVDDTWLWGVVRHPNYAGYYVWRLGITLATGSWVAALGTAAIDFAMFYNSIPAMANYMASKYGRQWDEYEDKVQYRLFPGIF